MNQNQSASHTASLLARAARILGVVLGFAGIVWGVHAFVRDVDESGRRQAEAVALAAEQLRSGPCSDEAHLLATTFGVGDQFACPNIRHRMQVQPATVGGEEIGALVLCKCVRGGDDDARADR